MKTKQSKTEKLKLETGMLDSLPMGISFIVFGSIFGVMAIQIGLSPNKNKIPYRMIGLFRFVGKNIEI